MILATLAAWKFLMFVILSYCPSLLYSSSYNLLILLGYFFLFKYIVEILSRKYVIKTLKIPRNFSFYRPPMDSLQDFYRLAAGDQKTRVAAVASLGRSLPPSPAGPFCGLEQLDKNLSYALRRLAKGLASSRQSARLGFTLALAQVCACLLIVCPDYQVKCRLAVPRSSGRLA